MLLDPAKVGWAYTRVTLSVGATLGRLGMGSGGYKLARALSEAGWSVNVVCMGTDAWSSSWQTRVVDVQPILRLAQWTPLRAHSGYMLALGNNLFDWHARRLIGRPDVLYAYTDQALFTVRAARVAGARTVLHAANTQLVHMKRLLDEEHGRFGLPQRLVSPLMVKKVLREYEEVDCVRAQSTLVQQTLVEGGVPASKVVHIPPSVDSDWFLPAVRQRESFTVAFVGSFDLRKGLPYLLRAFDRLDRPGTRLILHGGAGSRPMQQLLEPYRRRPDVVFRSGDPRPTYQESSVCVVPSIEDGFSYVVLEGLASGLPVITTENVGGKDCISEGENGYVVPIRDADALAERLRFLYDHPGQRQQMGRHARATAARYTFAREGQSLQALFTRLVGA